MFLLLRILTISISKDIVSYKDQRKIINTNTNTAVHCIPYAPSAILIILGCDLIDGNISVMNNYSELY